jgi:hypothetical protein
MDEAAEKVMGARQGGGQWENIATDFGVNTLDTGAGDNSKSVGKKKKGPANSKGLSKPGLSKPNPAKKILN